VWKTTDGGETFRPTFDDQPVQAIGALAVAPSDRSIVWAGTGEAWAIRDADVMGDGVYRSTDGGESWVHMGLDRTGRIGKILIHPLDPNVVFACALGRVTGPQEERGVFRTENGGETWERVLFVDENTGCSGLSMDPNNPDVIFAGTWDTVMHTWVMHSGGPGSAVYVTRNGGDDWTRLGEEEGLPRSPVGKIDVAVAPSDPNRVYALIQTAAQGSVWRSDDGGRSWDVVSWDRTLIGRAGYYIRIVVNPENEDEVVVMNSSSHRSLDGGRTWPERAGGCGDCHDVWMDPTNGDHWAVTGDGGAASTTDHGGRYNSFRLPNGQMYHVWVDDQVPYWIYSNRQDDGTMRGPSNSPVQMDNVPSYSDPEALVGYGTRGGGGQAGGRGGFGGFGGFGGGDDWESGLGGCESGFTIPVPGKPDIVWSSCYGNKITRYDARQGIAHSVSPWKHILDHPPEGLTYRCHWTSPVAMDPFEDETIYYGCNVIFRTRDQGQSWDVISPDLSTQDPERIAWSGGIPGAEPQGVIGDNLGQFYGEVVFAIAPSKLEQGLIWAGTNDGLVWVTRDGGDDWTRISNNARDLPEWGTIRKIEPSAFDPGTAYVAVDLHLEDDSRPYLYKITDYGRAWTDVTGDLPSDHPLDYVMSVAENPNREGMLFVGTGHAFYYSMDDGAHWTQLQEGLPAAPVSWVTVEPRYHDVVISTYGRGLFILRDITRLEQADAVSGDPGVFLFEPRPGFRMARNGSAEFLYSLPSQPQSPVSFEVLNDGGTVIRTFEMEGRSGLNTATWDLMYDGPMQIVLRSIPPDNPHIWEEARFLGQETRPIIHWGISGPMRRGAIAAPGDYFLRMTVDGRSVTRPFTVMKDPYLPASVEDLRASTAAQVRITSGINRTVDMVNRLETMRKQIEDMTAGESGDAEALVALEELDRTLYEVELHFLSRTDLHSDDKWYVEAYKVYMQYLWLSGELGLGASDVAGGADHRPTAASMEWLRNIEGELEAGAQAFEAAVDEAVPAFNREWEGRLPPIVIPESGGGGEPRPAR